MSIFSAIAAAVAKISEGSVLAASVYLVNRGVKHPIKKSKK